MIAGIAVVVAGLWTAAGIAWAGVLDEPETWTPPTVVVHPDAMGVDRAAAQAVVDRLADDPRGWRTDLGHLTVQIVPPGYRDTESMPGLIGAAYPDERLALVTDEAWTRLGSRLAATGATLGDQRTWIVLHEIGHVIGHDHTECSGRGPAPVMRPAVYEIGVCAFNVWPRP